MIILDFNKSYSTSFLIMAILQSLCNMSMAINNNV